MNPSIYSLYFLFGYWGITTILFFWAALIKATRSIAGNNQGVSFGALEAGRGLVASLCASIAVFLYSNNSLLEFLTNIISKNLSPLSIVIFFYSCVTFLSSIVILLFFKEEVKQAKANKIKYNIGDIYKNKKPILCISIIVFSAYTCYKAIDYYSLYFYEILEFSKEKSAYVMAIFSYSRPIAALLAGLIADKITSRSCTKFLFFFMLVAYAFLSIFNLDKQTIAIVYVNLIISMVGVFALRGIFYSLLEDSYIPSSITGAAVGIISFIGYLPDIFVGPLFGLLLDLKDIKVSFKIFFVFLFLISTIGFITAIYLKKKLKT
jgi:sugar phosphate permease